MNKEEQGKYEEQDKKRTQLIAKCWTDEGFKQKLLADPAATLKAEGVDLPAGRSIKVLENTDKVLHLVIPARSTELSDEDLDKVAAGVSSRLTTFGSGGGKCYIDPMCFLTTACTQAAGLPDDCHSLKALRAFRDAYVKQRADGPSLILDYYATAPAIVDAINTSEAGKKEWDHIYGQIVAITSLIDAGNPEGAFGKYREMFLRLRATYLPSYRQQG